MVALEDFEGAPSQPRVRNLPFAQEKKMSIDGIFEEFHGQCPVMVE